MNVHPSFKDRITEEDLSPVNTIEMEQSVLGCLLMNNSVLDDLPPELCGDHFHEPVHGDIFDEIKRLHSLGRIAQPLNVKTALNIDKIGSMPISAYLAKMASENLGPLSAAMQAPEIILEAKKRELSRLALKLREAVFGPEISLADEIEAITARLAEIKAEMAGEVFAKSPGDRYMDFFTRSQKEGGIAGVPIAVPALAKVLGENVFAATNVYALLGASGEGKTATTVQLILGAIRAGHPVQFLSYDQMPEECVRQMIAQHLEIDVKQQNDPQNKMTASEQDKCVMFAEWVNRQPLEIIRCKREGIRHLLGYARRFIKRYGNGKTPLIVIDHVRKVVPTDRRATPDVQSGEVNMEAKAFAGEFGCSFLILNQRNGEYGKRFNPRPMGKDLYGGEGAKQDYDSIAYIYRPEHWKGEMMASASDGKEKGRIEQLFAEFGGEDVAEFGTLKVRFGRKGLRARARFVGRYTRYDPIDENEQPELI